MVEKGNRREIMEIYGNSSERLDRCVTLGECVNASTTARFPRRFLILASACLLEQRSVKVAVASPTYA